MSRHRKKRAERSDDTETAEELLGPGVVLGKARAKRGLSRKDVAAKLRLDLAVVSALEDDNYDELPEPIFVSGYLRNYARLVDVSEDLVMDSYRRLGFEPPPVVPPVRGRAQARSSDRLVRSITYSLVILLISLSLIWWWRSRGLEEPVAVSGTPGPAQVGQSGPVPRQPAATLAPAAELITEAEVEPEPAPPPSVALAPAAPQPAAGAEPEPPAVVPDATPIAAEEPPAGPASEPAAVPSSDTVVPAGASVLVLHFTQDSWTEVKDANGNRLLYDLGRGGTDRTLHGTAPFSVFLGYAAGVTVEYNGQAFDHSPYIRQKLARFTVGEADAARE